eukprot:scaffold243_cov163-Ochromonas_danica.AAC.2
MVFMKIWPFASIAMYIAPVVSIISSAEYFGLWLENAYKVAFASIVCTSLGALVALASAEKAVHIILILFCVLGINYFLLQYRIVLILGTLSFFLATIWPALESSSVTVWESFYSILVLMNILHLIVGISLLLPCPALAIHSARGLSMAVSRRISRMLACSIKIFLASDDMDICRTEIDHHLAKSMGDIAVLKALIRFVSLEEFLFYPAKGMSAALTNFLAVGETIMKEMHGIKTIVRRLEDNGSQVREVFAKEAESILMEMAVEMEIALVLVGEHLESFDPYDFKGCQSKKLVKVIFSSMKSPLLRPRDSVVLIEQHLQSKQFYRPRARSLEEDSRIAVMPNYSFINIEEGSAKFALSEMKIGVNTRQASCSIASSQPSLPETEKEIVSSQASVLEDLEATLLRLSNIRSKVLLRYGNIRQRYILLDQERSTPPPSRPATPTKNRHSFDGSRKPFDLNSSPLSPLSPQDDRIVQEVGTASKDPDLYMRLLRLSSTTGEEVTRLNLRYFSECGAYLHRLSVMTEYIASLRSVFEAPPDRSVPKAYLTRLIRSLISNTWEVFNRCVGCQEENLMVLRSAVKAAVVISLCSALLLYQVLSGLYRGGLWMTIAVIIIRQDTVSSSFLTSMQRLEGTVIGTMYAFFVYTLLVCDTGECGFLVEMPVIVVWVAFCGLFRDGPQHGYSATVASVTPIALLLSTDRSLDGAWGRIEETFLGILIYLAFDNLFFPKRTYPTVKRSVLLCIEQSRLLFGACVHGVETLVKMEKICQSITLNAAGDIEDTLDNFHLGVIESWTNLHPNISIAMNSSLTIAGEDMKCDEEGAGISMNSSLLLKHSSDEIRRLLGLCKAHFVEADHHLHILDGELKKQSFMLSLVQYEPELWHKTFPQVAYQSLWDAFARVYHTGYALSSGAKAFIVIMLQMMQKGENIDNCLMHFNFMIGHLFLVSARADEALVKTHQLFTKFYAHEDIDEVDLGALTGLQRISSQLLDVVEQHFRQVYIHQPPEVLLSVSAYFLVAWQCSRAHSRSLKSGHGSAACEKCGAACRVLTKP